ncbi:type I polyketide synthase [Sorangium sp. So ce315]|uniref:type I polyketide synthase n=1 Tax=Sorangium sp. So ce315 TaxID=3133299 RepID=UPI003F60DFB4
MEPNASSHNKLRETLVRSLREVERLRERVAALESGSSEPVAIVGMGLRLPGGVVDRQGLWPLLAKGVDAVGPVPKDRFDIDAIYHPDPDQKGKSYVREAAFMDRVDLFDAAFFGISPREARHIDPQHRLLIEAAWRALEDAGVPPLSRKDSRTGVFVGIGPSDYEYLQDRTQEAEAYAILGMHTSFAAGRVAFHLGLQGPAVSIDTACSSSLVALHLACQALRRGECDLALCGGVQVLLAPEPFALLSRTRALAADGRSKTFSANADGYGRGEGVVVLALERLGDALARGHDVLAVVRGSAVNHDGASSGITAPNGTSQQKVMRAALSDARLAAEDVDFVECHGTGTSLGDPIEVHAVSAVYGHGRAAARPLLLGTLKTNIGHLEAAAGLAGVAKIIASFQAGALPPTLHTSPRNPHIDWESLPVEVVDALRPWPRRDAQTPRRAAVSAFGLSGTNAHVLLEEAPRAEERAAAAATAAPAEAWPFLVSGKTRSALRAQAAALGGHLRGCPGLALADVACSLATARSHLDERAVVIAGDLEALLEALDAIAQERAHPAVVLGEAKAPGNLAALFTGQGSQHPGMGGALYRVFPVFRGALDAAAAVLDPALERPLREVMFAPEGSSDAALLDQTAFAQAALFALEVALFRLLESWGFRPDVLLGHSIGEVVAAHVAGVLSLEDACKLVAARGRLMQALPAGGAMVSLQASEDEVRPRLAGYEGKLDVAAVNGPRSTVISGDEDAVLEVARRFEELGRKATRLSVSHAFHSPRMEGMLEAFGRVAAGLSFHPPRIPIVSNATGRRATAEALCSPGAWVRHAREAVRFLDGVRTLEVEGVTTFLELGPRGVLSAMGQACLSEQAQAGAAFLPALRRDRREIEALLAALAALHARGHALDWERFFAPTGARRIPLPGYAFQRERHWLAAPTERPDGAARGASTLADSGFWAAIARGDVDALTETLRLDERGLRPSLEALLPALAAHQRERREQDAVDARRYRVAWRPIVEGLQSGAPPGDVAGPWLLVVPAALAEDPLAQAVARALADRGAQVVAIPVESAAGREALAERLRRALLAPGDGRAPRGVISLLALAEGPLPERPAPPPGLALTLALAQALGDAAVHAPLWLLTRGAVSVGRSDRGVEPAQSMIWGLGRVVALEHPERWGGLIDLPAVPAALDDRGRERLAAALGRGGAEDQLALRAAGAFARRLVRAPLGDAEVTAAYRPRGAALITGGTGAIGAHVARWLARSGAEHLVLTSRRGRATPGADALAAELEALGARVTIAACDAADRGALAELFGRLDAEGISLRAVVHAAGVERQTPIAQASPDELAEVAAGKVWGAKNLDELVGARPLDAFVLFSSGAAIWGGALQGPYAAANAYLDALAEARRALGQPATSIAWGPWAGGGMADDAALAALRRRGLSAMSPALGVAALQQALDRGETSLTVAEIDWSVFAPAFAAARPRPLLHDLPEARRALEGLSGAPSAGAQESALCAELRALAESERLRRLVDLTRAEAAAVLGHADASGLDPRTGFVDLGLDSLMVVELRARLQRATGLRLPATLAFDHPSPHRVATFLHAQLLPALGPAPRADTRAAAGRGARGRSEEAIAVVGIGLRLPGGCVDLAGLWQMLEQGIDAVGPIPEDRFDIDAVYDPDPDQQGKSYVRAGAFLDGIDLFDAAFFGISPREARHVDPQHRLLLEAAWQALEDAGVPPASLRDSATGVFVGIGPSEYEMLQGDRQEADAYAVLGTHTSFAAGRLAFTLGLQGPAISVDTACSSSLVALHLACQALRRGECDLALAAGVQVIASPAGFALLSRARAVAPDGRSKTFSANADGYGRGEGVVVVCLERLSEARDKGHAVLAVVRGSAVNHDGASSGITAPNGTSQQKVLRAALLDAGLSPGEVDFVECHGTGTSLGDPIEVQALSAVYGEGRAAERPLLLGALKTNIGHLESAAGLAGVAKVIASLRQGALPSTLHTTPRNPHIDWGSLPVEVVDTLKPWPRRDERTPRRAAVSAFGLSGTNAHVILEEAPLAPEDAPSAARTDALGPLPFLISGRTEPALRAQAAALRAHLRAHPNLALGDVARALATTRTHFERRAAVIGQERGALLDALSALAEERPHPRLALGGGRGEGKLALLFTGQGSQHRGMGCALYEAFPAFRRALDAAMAHLDPALDRPLSEVLFSAEGSADAALLDQTAFTQPALFALEVALFRLLEGWGLAPELLLGHSIGEIAAAHVAGVLSLEDACALVSARARLMQALPAGGAMVSLQASEDEVRSILSGRAGQVDIAAQNGPLSTVIAGDEDAVLAVAEHFEASGRKATRLAVSHAFHSPRMDGMLDAFRRVVERLSFSPPRIPIVSNVTGKRATAEELGSADYWVRHAREAVRFFDGMRALEAEGARTFLELGPHGVLSAMGQGCLSAEAQERAAFVAALRKDRPEVEGLLAAVSALHVRGHTLDWAAFFAPRGARRVPLPTYAFQRERFWIEAPPPGAAPRGTPRGRYPLAGARIELPDGSFLHTVDVGPAAQRYIAAHLVYGRIVVPGAFHLAVLLAVAESHWPDQAIELCDVQFVRALSFDRPTERAELQIQLTPLESGEGGLSATVSTRRDGAFAIHATAVLRPVPPGRLSPRSPLQPPSELQPIDWVAQPVAWGSELPDWSDRNIDWGRAWWWVRGASNPRARTGLGRFEPPTGVPADDAPLPGGFIDNAFWLERWSGAELQRGNEVPRLPFAVERLVWYGRRATPAFAEYALRADHGDDADARSADLAFWDRAGTPLGHLEGFTSYRAPADRFLPDQAPRDLYIVAWTETPAPAPERPVRWVVLGGDPAELVPAGPEPGRYADLVALQRALDRGARAPDAVVVPWEAEGADLVAAAHGATRAALALLQAFLADERLAACRLVVLTRGAVAARAGEQVPRLAHAPLWGLVRAAQSELPERAILLVDSDDHEDSLRALPLALTSTETQLALRAGKMLCPRLARPSPSPGASSPSPRPLDPEGTVLVTGGTGALGVIVARHLVERHGVRHLLLLSRQGLRAPGAEALREELSAAGATVALVACDAADRPALQRALESIPPAHPLTGVVHVAGVVDDGILPSLAPAQVDRVLSPKVDAAYHLHELTRALDLPLFVLFSSLSGVLGAAGQAGYAAANTFLDALAAGRRAEGLSGLSLAWGPWAEGGMAARMSDVDRERMRRRGIPLLSSAEGLALFDAALGRPEALVAPVRLDPDALGARGEDTPPLLRGIVRAAPRRPGAAPASPSAGALKPRLSGLPAPERERALLDLVRAEAAAVLGAAPGAIEPRRPLQEIGLDSLMALELRSRLGAAAGLRLPATVVFDHPTLAALAERLRDELALDVAEDAPPARDEAEIRRAIASIPLARLEEAGLVDVLLRLAGHENGAAPELHEDDGRSAIDAMNLDDLVKLALDEASVGT